MALCMPKSYFCMLRSIQITALSYQGSFLDRETFIVVLTNLFCCCRLLISNQVTIIPWPKFAKYPTAYDWGQSVALIDSVFRFKWLYNWTVVLDSDDYLIPTNDSYMHSPNISSNITILPLVEMLCPYKIFKCVSIQFAWIDNYIDCGKRTARNETKGAANWLPNRVHVHADKPRAEGKSMHRYSRTYDVSYNIL